MLALPSKPRGLAQRFFGHRRGIDKHLHLAARLGNQPPRQPLQPFLDHVMVIPPPRIHRNGAQLRVIKRDGRHEELDRQKLVGGVGRACEKRPISVQEMELLIDGVLQEIEAEFEREVPSTVIGKKVMDRLERLDEIAYVRFASVYRRFRDVSQFVSEVEGLIARE